MNTDPNRSARRRQPPRHPTITTAGGHQLACYPASVLTFIVDSWDRYLLFRRPGQPGWEVVSGVLEPGETVPQAVLRTVKEAAGDAFLALYLGVLDTYTFVFDANLPPLISICCLLRHRGGELRPGKDVKEAEFRWWELSELDSIDLAVPRDRWDLLTRAVDMSRYLRDAREPDDGIHSDSSEFP